jgi:EAL domain-containing protein (putative c-di-GMP-specific phosphodiesterase class I)
VTAEGVERPDQVAVLERNGCDAAQGFLFSAPVEPATADEMLSRPDRALG